MRIKGGRSFDRYLKKNLRDPEFRKAFDEEDVYSRVAIQIAKLREEQDISQRELAELLHTTQQTVSRLEDPSNESFSLYTLVKLAQAFHKRLKIQFV